MAASGARLSGQHSVHGCPDREVLAALEATGRANDTIVVLWSDHGYHLGSLRRHGQWTVPTRLALVRRVGSVVLDLTHARFAGPVVVIELDMVRGSVHIRLPDGASASIDDVIVYGGSARDRRKDPPSEGKPHVVLTGRVVMGSVSIRGPRRPPLRRGPSTASRDWQ